MIGELRPFVIDYISLDENFTALERIEGDIATSFEMMPDDRSGEGAKRAFEFPVIGQLSS